MPTWLKVVLVVGGLLLVLLVVAVVGVVYVAQKYGPGLVEAGKHAVEEGRAYGSATDEQGCVGESVARHKRAEGFTDTLNTSLFMRSCLDASRPTPNFCDAVPGRLEFVKAARWQLDECRRYGLKPEKQCGQLFQQVQQYCEQRGRSKAGALTEDESGTEDSDPPPPAPARSK